MADKVGYVIQFSKQTAMAGEVITVNTQLPEDATSEDLSMKIVEIGNALDARTKSINDKVLARTGKNLEELGVELPEFSPNLPK